MRRNAGVMFWCLMWFLLILGVAAEVFYWLLKHWYLKPDTESWSWRIFGIIDWAAAFALCALLLRVISYAPNLLRALAAMWRPLVLVLAAAYLLFANDQGRELGVSLMADNNGWRLFFLFLALIYWAANNWHTARLGLRAAMLLAAAPSWRLRASFRRDQSFFGGGKPTRARLSRTVAGGVDSAACHCHRDNPGLGVRSPFTVAAKIL
jgi:hypothetical protein